MVHLCLYGSIPKIPARTTTNHQRIFLSGKSRQVGNSSSRRYTVNCRGRIDDDPLSGASPYAILGVEPNCTSAELKAAFRSKVSAAYHSMNDESILLWKTWQKLVKQYHPDVIGGGRDSDTMIRLVIQAYEMLTDCSRSEIIEREYLDPFDQPECEAFDLFVNEVLCLGKGCSQSCVRKAPHVFSYASTGTARATSQGHGESYEVQLAAGQCPQSCIHYVTPSQRIVLEELLDGILDKPYDCSAEADLLYSLIVKAKFENDRYHKPKPQP